MEVDLESSACEAEAAEAVRRLEQYNSAVAGDSDLNLLASPSKEVCQWCPFKTICPAFWTSTDESWVGSLDGEAIAGVFFIEPPQAVQSGAAWSIMLAVDAGTMAHQEITISPLGASVYFHFPSSVRARVRFTSGSDSEAMDRSFLHSGRWCFLRPDAP